MYQQLWGYKVEEKLYLGVHEQKRLNTIGPEESYRVSVCVWSQKPRNVPSRELQENE
jgi:hypothetical protein